MPFECIRRNDANGEVLTLVLDTPGSAVNIFNHATAHQTLEIMAGVTPENTRAVVIRTAKPTSFVNGVGLLLANASKTREDIARASGIVREAFAAVRSCPVPVIAAVQGTCWGCGVEFVLHTGYRIVADTYDTHFYMTELNDYLFVPVFRSTENLPRAVGLSSAIDLLLWGERWSGRTAASRGLVNECASPEGFDDAVANFTTRVLRGDVQSCLPEQAPSRRHVADPSNAGAITRARARIARLPPSHRKVYNDTLALMAEAAAGDTAPDHADRELTACAESSLADEGRAAFGFFYLRQMAATVAAAGSKPVKEPLTVAFDEETHTNGLASWHDELRARPLPPHRVLDGVSDTQATVRFTSETRADSNAIACAFRLDSARPDADLALWKLPNHRYLELSERTPASLGQLAPGLLSYFVRGGYQVARTRGAQFTGPRLVQAWIAMQARYLANGGSPDALDVGLRDHGYVRRVRDLAAIVGTDELARAIAIALPDVDAGRRSVILDALTQPASDDPTDSDPVAVAAVDVALLEAALDAIEHDGAHASFVDLAARELLDYPIRLRSLLSHLTPQTAAASLDLALTATALVPPSTADRVSAWISRGKSFYR